MKLKKKYRVGDIIRVSSKIRYATSFAFANRKAPPPFWGFVSAVSDTSGYSIERINGRGGTAWWSHDTVIGYAGNLANLLKGKLK